MKKYILFIILVSYSAISADELRIAISHYPPYVDKERSDMGIYPRYLKTFFKKEKIKFKFIYMPYARSLYGLDKNIIDMTILGKSSLLGIKRKILVSDEFFKVRFCLFHDLNKKVKYKELSDLRKYKVVSIIKSPVNSMLDDIKIKYSVVPHIESAFNMLISERSDVFPTSYAIGNEYISLNKEKYGSVKCEIDIFKEPIVIAFTKKNKHQLILDKLNKYILENKLTVKY
jgi:ABC-type amino acid transport substrate-binding protein